MPGPCLALHAGRAETHVHVRSLRDPTRCNVWIAYEAHVHVRFIPVQPSDLAAKRGVGARLWKSVRGLRGVDLAHPGTDAATDMDCVGQPSSVNQRQDLCRSHAGLAVEHHLLVVR